MLLEKLQNILPQLPDIQSELWLGVLLFIIVVADLFVRNKQSKLVAYLFIIGLVANLYLIANTRTDNLPIFGGMIAIKQTDFFLKVVFSCCALSTVVMDLQNWENTPYKRGEFYTILTSTLLGLQFVIISANFLMLYLSIEIVSLSSYLLSIFCFDRKSVKNSMKYLLFGAVASGIMLYGISFIYALSGEVALNQITPETLPAIPMLFGFILIFAGLFFKISAVPFHFWTPDVYETAPTSVTAFYSVAPKVAGLAALSGLMSMFKDSYHSLHIDILFAIVAGLSILVGNLGALQQKSLKKLFAYSSIAHAGFLMIALIPRSATGNDSFLFYTAVYLLMNYAAFMIVALIEKHYQTDTITHVNGLGNQSIYVGIVTIVVVLSLIGLPITAGFTAKLLVFSSLWENYQITGHRYIIFLIAFGLLNVAIALVYYLRIPYLMFFKKTEQNIVFSLTKTDYILLACLAIPLILLFFSPQIVINFVNTR